MLRVNDSETVHSKNVGWRRYNTTLYPVATSYTIAGYITGKTQRIFLVTRVAAYIDSTLCVSLIPGIAAL